MKLAIRKVALWGSVLVIGALAVIVFVVPSFVPWSEANCRHEQVDIRTGRVRTVRYLAYCKVSDTVRDSVLSRALPREMVGETEPAWRMVNTFSPGVRHSPHYAFHGAYNQMQWLAHLWERYELPEALRRKTALHLLAVWRQDDRYFPAGDYLDRLWEMLRRDRRQALQTLTTQESPMVGE